MPQHSKEEEAEEASTTANEPGSGMRGSPDPDMRGRASQGAPHKVHRLENVLIHSSRPKMMQLMDAILHKGRDRPIRPTIKTTARMVQLMP
jgi:hypothetical protein